MLGRLVRVGASSSGRRRRWWVSPIPSQSARWWTAPCRTLPLSRPIGGRTCSGTVWRPRCSNTERLYLRLVICCGIAVPIQPPFMPKSIWLRFVPSPWRGREETDETPAAGHGRVYCSPAQLRIQTARYGHRTGRFRLLLGAESTALYHDGLGVRVGDAASGPSTQRLGQTARFRSCVRSPLERDRSAHRDSTGRFA